LPLGVNSTGHSSPPCSTRVPIHLPSSPHPPPILPWGTHRTLWLLPYCHLDPPGLPHFQFVRRSGHCAKGNFAGQGEGKRDNILGSLLFPPLLFPPLLSSPLLSSSSPLLSSPLLSSPLLSYPLLVVFISSPPLSSPLLSSPLLSSPLLSSPLLFHLTWSPSRTHSAGHHVPKLPKPNPSPPILSSWWCNKTSRMQPFLAWWHSEP
ncbi:hypothetical protein CLOP_g7611, partial [Closterium sp. NIES-67]